MPDFLSTAKDAARRAGQLVLRESRSQHKVECKGGFDFVTEVDRMSEELIRSILISAFPEHGFFGEEQISGGSVSEDEALDALPDYAWIVDALDGTTNFIRGIPQYAISIALLHRGRPEVGVIYDPNRDELFSAQRGKGAWLNDQPIHVSDCRDMKNAIVSFGFPAADMERRALTMERISRIGMQVGSLRVFNCAALLLAYAACGRTDLSFEEGLHLWDMAAGILLVSEAGGQVSLLDGSPMDRHSRENLGGNTALREAFLAAMK